VVVPAYDAERYVGASLRSLQEQTLPSWRCVVVDDGSRDGTAAIVQAVADGDQRVRLVRQPNAGPAAARSRGLAELPADVGLVGFLDSDDTLTADALAALAKSLAARPDAVGVFGVAELMDEQGRPVRAGVHPDRQRARLAIRGRRLVPLDRGADTTFADLVVWGPIWPSAVGLHRRHVLEEVGGFDPSFPVQEDWELYLRMSRRGPFAFLDRQVAWYRRHGANLTERHLDNQLQRERLLHAAWTFPDNTLRQRRDVAAAWRAVEARHVLHAANRARRAAIERHLRGAAVSVRAAGVSAAQLVRPGPPPASASRVRLTRRAEPSGRPLV